MPRSWASSPDLHLEIELGNGRGRRAALEAALRDAIRDGRLQAGTVLPSSRGLARDLGLSRGTVLDAYTQLLAEGYILTRPGAVTAVADVSVAPDEPVDAGATPPRVRVDFRPGLLDLASTFPRVAWMRAVRSALNRASDDAFDYGDPRGLPELRAALASYLARARGVVTTPDQIMVCAGFAQGLALLAGVLRDSGVRVIGMEDPCLRVHREIVGRHGLATRPLAVDGEGARTDVLDDLGVDAAIVTPAHQYPTGVTLTPGRRKALVDWARRRELIAVEDDYDGEFRYDRQPVGALQGLAPDHVVYAGTASKTLAPGVRLGWLVLPRPLVEPVVDANSMARGGWTPPALEQLALAGLLAGGQFDRHLRRLRAGYRARRDLLVDALSDVPGIEITGIAAGLHLLVGLPSSRLAEDEIRVLAEERGIALGYLASHWHAAADRPPSVIVGFARPGPTAFDGAVRDLVELLHSVSPTTL